MTTVLRTPYISDRPLLYSCSAIDVWTRDERKRAEPPVCIPRDPPRRPWKALVHKKIGSDVFESNLSQSTCAPGAKKGNIANESLRKPSGHGPAKGFTPRVVLAGSRTSKMIPHTILLGITSLRLVW